ncbi:MAG: hypothetical protein GF418_02500 [Chitinivibrionales bacterium]|nr:hypothetical protein [Chitinivibrionales bacterium]MBD3394472.1 hypothetical protein [Chitinivibrionales bacterium]
MDERGTTHLVVELTRSYTLQAELYRKLSDLVQKIYGQLVLSRGDLSRVLPLFEEKQKLLNAITAERGRTQEPADRWQREKGSVPRSEATDRLDTVLARVETTIRGFLETEQQLEHYLKHLADTEGASPDAEAKS